MGEDFELFIKGDGKEARVVIVFSHERWPGVRFGHEFPSPEEAEDWEPVLLMEEVETGGLARLMRDDPAADAEGVIWMNWR